MTDAAAGRHRLVAPGAGRAQRATGSSLQGRPNSATDMGHACPRSLRAFAQNDQQKTAPVTLISALTRAREASGGNNRERPARSAGAGGVRLRRRSAVGIFVLVKWSLVDRLLSWIWATMELGR